MNYFKAAEQVLSSVPLLKQALCNLKKREQRLLDSSKPGELQGLDYSKPFADSSYVNDTLNDLLELSECEGNIAVTEKKIVEIESVVNQLPPEMKRIIVLWYFDKKSKETVMEELHIESSRTIYNLRNKAVGEFALRYYGAAAISSV